MDLNSFVLVDKVNFLKFKINTHKLSRLLTGTKYESIHIHHQMHFFLSNKGIFSKHLKSDTLQKEKQITVLQ